VLSCATSRLSIQLTLNSQSQVAGEEAEATDALADVLAEGGPDPSLGTSRYIFSKVFASSWLSTKC
jgi:hypothetical protein